MRRYYLDRDGIVHSPIDYTPVSLRPVVVIDPEDREQVDRLTDAYARHDFMQDALRSLIAPPKPPEPQGLGAVVEDRHGTRWVRVNERTASYWRPADASSISSFRSYSAIEAIRVLSEGVTE